MTGSVYSPAAAVSDEPLSLAAVDGVLGGAGLAGYHTRLLVLVGVVWTSESMEMLLVSFIGGPVRCDFAVGAVAAALLVTAVGMGMMFGNVLWGRLGDRWGRCFALQWSTVMTGVFGLCSAVAPGYYALLVARFLVGVGIGGSVISVTLLTEMTPPSKRGEYNALLCAFWSAGAILEAAAATLTVPRAGWRPLVALTALPVLAVAAHLAVSPPLESIPWLISRRRYTDARLTLRRLVEQAHPHPDAVPVTDQELSPLASTHAPVHKHGDPENPPAPPTYSTTASIATPAPATDIDHASDNEKDSMWMQGTRYIAVMLCALYFISAFLYYGLVLLQPEVLVASKATASAHASASVVDLNGAGVGAMLRSVVSGGREGAGEECAVRALTTGDFLSTLVSSIGELPGTFMTALTVSSLGRRPTIGYGLFLLFVIFGLLVVLPSGEDMKTVQTVCFFVARGLSEGSYQALIILCSELYPPGIRARSSGTAAAVSRVGLLLTPFVAQVLIHRSVAHAATAYAATALIGTALVVALPVETTRRSPPASMQQLKRLLRAPKTTPALYTGMFKHDPAAHPFVRALRWTARVDAPPA